jgi:hypothetical protein
MTVHASVTLQTFVFSSDDITSSIVINWSPYNESLVRRSEILLDFGITIGITNYIR